MIFGLDIAGSVGVILGAGVVLGLFISLFFIIRFKKRKKILTVKGTDCALELKNIVKVYGEGDNKVKALKGINLKFRKSEFVSILGPSGCGKTTLLNIIGGLDRYTSGDLIINGKSTKRYGDRDWDTYRNNSIGFVFQSYNLIPHQSVLSNVELSLTLSGIGRLERKRRAKEVIKQVGLAGLENKRPNQLSGGQMQRVAIARALVNNPEIILADEPTGALDTETSIQILDLLKEVAKDRLVIMVTHNPDLAKRYSTRIVSFLDGEKKDDTNPFIEEKEIEIVKKKKGKSHMLLSTAISLSLSNLRTKKGRTVLTAIAGSIGIIGIALVLAVSSGFSTYINKLQADTLSVYPLTISEATIDLSDFNKLTNNTINNDLLKQAVEKKVYTKEMFGDLTNMLKSNKITEEYVKFVKDFADKENKEAAKTQDKWAYCIQKSYGFDVNDFIFADISFNNMKTVCSIDSVVQILENMFNQGMKNSNMNISAEFVREYIPTVSMIPDNNELLDSQYDIYGKWPTKPNELVLTVNKYNQLTDITLALLGFRSIDSINYQNFTVEFGGNTEFEYDDIIDNCKFYFISDQARYGKISDNQYYQKTFTKSMLSSIDQNEITELKIVGIAKIKDDVKQGVLDVGIGYTQGFADYIVEKNLMSTIVQDALEGHTERNSTTGIDETVNTVGVKKSMMSADNTVYTLRTLGGSKDINKLSIYSSNYQTKEKIKEHLDGWNTPIQSKIDKEKAKETSKQDAEYIEDLESKIVHYSDSTELLFFALNSVVDAVKIVLICFTSISLVVSSIMIGIITYVSVVERTKEIGVLRALGARKKDISRIFNAETFLIGLFAGLIGVGISYLLTIPINLIVANFIENIGRLANLELLSAGILVVISFILTLIAGIIPSRIAAKKDPVVALRTE